jgi:hypothetical protein
MERARRAVDVVLGGAGVLLAIAFAASGARAQDDAAVADAPRSSALAWVRLPGAEGCPAAQDVARAVEARLGRTVFVAAGVAELTIEGRAERVASPPGFRAIVRITDASGAVLGERTLDQAGDDCALLLAPLALAIALTIDPNATTSAAPPADESDPDPDPDPEVRVETRIVRERVEVEVPVLAPRWRLELALSPQVAVGLLPFVAPGGGLAILLTPPGFVPFIVQGAIYPWSRAELAGGAWVDHLAALAGIGMCPLALREDRVAFLACATIDAGAQVVVGEQGVVAVERERVLVQLDVSARVHVRIVGPLMFHAGLALLVPFRTEPWLATGDVVYHRPEPVAGVLDLGVGLDLEI